MPEEGGGADSSAAMARARRRKNSAMRGDLRFSIFPRPWLRMMQAMAIDLMAAEKRARALLGSVSRSFYLSLRFVPGPVRGPLSLAYLLARATDTFADSGAMAPETRLAALRAMHGALAGEKEARAALGRCREAALAAGGAADFSPGEAALLRRLDEVLVWHAAMPPAERSLIDEVLGIIIGGQSDDITRARIQNAEELERYTYQVAGCVGEFWTRLCALKLPGYALTPMDALLASGCAFGQGLQLINVLRDVPKDARLGRSYLPGVGPEAAPEEKWRAAQPWLARCRECLAEGRLYTAGLRGIRSRFVVWLPLLLAEATLGLIEAAGPAAMAAPVKVPRTRMKRLVWRAGVSSLGIRHSLFVIRHLLVVGWANALAN